MPTPLTSTDVVNRAIQIIGDNQEPVTGNAPNFDNSVAGKAAAILYNGVVQTVSRQFGYDFSRNTASLTLTGSTAPFPWGFEYAYPTNGIQVRQVMPPSLVDPFDPIPVNWVVANTIVADVATKVIHTDLPDAIAVFTNQPAESLWDALFTEAVVRLLASELAMAIEGRPDTSRDMLESGSAFQQIGQGRDS